MATFKKLIPQNREIILAFGTILFCICSWSVRAFLYKVPSFLLYMDVGEIGSVFAYMMAFALLESLLVQFVMIIPAMILPSKWFREGFSYKAFLVIIVAAVSSIYYQDSLTYTYSGSRTILIWLGLTFLAMVILVLLSILIKPLPRILSIIVDQFNIFLYIYGSIGVISLVVVLYRLIV